MQVALEVITMPVRYGLHSQNFNDYEPSSKLLTGALEDLLRRYANALTCIHKGKGILGDPDSDEKVNRFAHAKSALGKQSDSNAGVSWPCLNFNQRP